MHFNKLICTHVTTQKSRGRILLSLQTFLCVLLQKIPFPYAKPLETCDLISVLFSVAFSEGYVKRNIQYCSLLNLAPFNQHSALGSYTFCSMFQYFIHFLLMSYIFLYGTPNLFNHSLASRYLNCFKFLKIVYNATITLPYCFLCRHVSSFPFGKQQGMASWVLW